MKLRCLSGGSGPHAGLRTRPVRDQRCSACVRAHKRQDGVPNLAEQLLTVAGAAFVSAALVLAPVEAQARTKLSGEEQKVVDLFSKSTSSVVNITNLSSRRDAFTSDMQEYPQGAGSGIVWDKQGHIVVRPRPAPHHRA